MEVCVSPKVILSLCSHRQSTQTSEVTSCKTSGLHSTMVDTGWGLQRSVYPPGSDSLGMVDQLLRLLPHPCTFSEVPGFTLLFVCF